MQFSVTEISNHMGIWSVIAEIHTSDGTLFLAERYARESFTLTYVVAFMPITAEEWTNGHYFDGPSTSDNRQKAQRHFLTRANDSMWS